MTAAAALLSPVTGKRLVPEGAALLRDADGTLWPVLDGIPFLRTGRDALRQGAVDRIQADDPEGALALLLADQDDWWTGPTPAEADLRRLVAARHTLTLRDAMTALCLGRVGDYFAHRWSDPTFLAGLALLETHWRPAPAAFELACGIGHYGRELMRRGTAWTGADVVFAKLWLARHWVVPEGARLICFDAAALWPLAGERFDLVFCHDAFYFLEPKDAVLAGLRALAGPSGRVTLGHIHNKDAATLSSGHAMTAADLARLFPDAAVFDDAELTSALAEGRAPRSHPVAALSDVEAFAVEDRPGAASPRALTGGIALPSGTRTLRLNPLYAAEDDGFRVRWPSPRYEAEYAALSTFPSRLDRTAALGPDPEAVRRRVVVDLPERW